MGSFAIGANIKGPRGSGGNWGGVKKGVCWFIELLFNGVDENKVLWATGTGSGMREDVKENGVELGARGTAGAIELLLATGVCGLGVGSTRRLTLLACTISANPAS